MDDLNQKSLTIKGTELIFDQMKTSMCKIVLEDWKEGQGFFYKLSWDKFLITNNHIINEENMNQKIKVYIDDNIEPKEIELKKRKFLTNLEDDITLIEIQDKDGISITLEIDNNENKSFNNESIYIKYKDKNNNIYLTIGLLNNLQDNNR